ncbi:MAG: hypothetical protein RIB98_09460 [Acidimicrobiales bacterium]
MAPQHVLDLTDELALLDGMAAAAATARSDQDEAYRRDGGLDLRGVRDLLSALQLKPVSGPMVDTPKGDVFDLAVYRATGDRHLATIFGTAG